MAELVIQSLPDLRWTAVHARPRCEKALAEYCRLRQITCYLPLLHRRARYQRRLVSTTKPMFPGYLFAQLDAEAAKTLLASHKAVRVLPVTAEREIALVAELRAVQALEQLQDRTPLLVHPELTVGTPVRIVSGPLAGFSGIVEKRRQNVRVSVSVEMLGRSVSADLDVGEIEVE